MDVNDIYRARRTMIEMLRDRNYELPEDIIDISFKEFEIMYKNGAIDIVLENMIVNFYISENNFAKKDLVKIYSQYEEDINLIIVISDVKPSAFIIKELQKDQYKNVELFTLNTILVNITKHELVPKHSKCTQEEMIELCQLIKCKPKQLPQRIPKIKVTDPVIRYHGMRVGDVCKIMRKSYTAGYTPYYRIVVR